MAKLPEWRRAGWKPNGPGACRCPDCGETVATNALARASHQRGCKVLKAKRAEDDRRATDTRKVEGRDGKQYGVGDTVRLIRDGERTGLLGKVRAIGDNEAIDGCVLVAGFIAWQKSTNFVRECSEAAR